jgi:hypothetical protein
MAIPNAKKYHIRRPDSPDIATIVAVLPKDADVSAYLSDAAKRFDWKACVGAPQESGGVVDKNS